MKDLEVGIRACYLQIAAPAFHGMEGIRKGLDTAVVSDGNGPMAPGGCLLDDSFGIGQGIHIAHGGMQMQLHALFTRVKVLALGHLTGHDGKGLQDGFVGIVVNQELTLNFQDAAVFHALQNRLCLLVFQEAADTDGGGIVCDIKVDDPGTALFQLLVFNSKDTAFHNDNAHIQAHVRHRYCLALEGFAVDGAAIGRRRFLLRCCRNGGNAGHHGGTHGVHSIKQRLTLQILACLDSNFYLNTELRSQFTAHRRNALQQDILSVSRKINMQGLPFPCPLGACQAAAGHGIDRNKQMHQVIRLHSLQLRGRIHRLQLQLSQTVAGSNILRSFQQEVLGNICIGRKCYCNRPGFRVNIGSGNGRLRQHPQKGLRRLIVREHIEEEYGFAHKILLHCFNSLK